MIMGEGSLILSSGELLNQNPLCKTLDELTFLKDRVSEKQSHQGQCVERRGTMVCKLRRQWKQQRKAREALEGNRVTPQRPSVAHRKGPGAWKNQGKTRRMEKMMDHYLIIHLTDIS